MGCYYLRVASDNFSSCSGHKMKFAPTAQQSDFLNLVRPLWMFNREAMAGIRLGGQSQEQDPPAYEVAKRRQETKSRNNLLIQNIPLVKFNFVLTNRPAESGKALAQGIYVVNC